jgi:hypothetical protein
MAVSGDGNTLALGMPVSHGNMGHLAAPGKLIIYKWNGTSWVQQGQQFIGPSSTYQFGMSVDLSYDGNVVVVGHAHVIPGSPNLEVYHFNATANSWQLRGSSFIQSGTQGPYGEPVCISHDGMVIAATEDFYSLGTNSSLGAVKIFEYASGNWYQRGSNITGKIPYGYFGRTLAMDSSGSTLTAGSSFAGSTAAGIIEVYDISTLVDQTEKSLKKAKKVSLYPNPFHQTTRLSFNLSSFELIEVFNLKGQLIHTQRLIKQSSAKLDFSQEENGIYLIRLSSPQGNTKTVKAIKQ